MELRAQADGCRVLAEGFKDTETRATPREEFED